MLIFFIFFMGISPCLFGFGFENPSSYGGGIEVGCRLLEANPQRLDEGICVKLAKIIRRKMLFKINIWLCSQKRKYSTEPLRETAGRCREEELKPDVTYFSPML
jgi:hypothetical protein